MKQENPAEAHKSVAAEIEEEIEELAEHFVEDQPSLQTPMGIFMTVAMGVAAIALCGTVIFFYYYRK